MAVGRLIVEAITVATIREVAERIVFRRLAIGDWLNEVSQPPVDASFQAGRMYTGLFYVLRNRIRRAFVVEHREGQPRMRSDVPEYFRESHQGAQPPYYPEEDEFPNFS